MAWQGNVGKHQHRKEASSALRSGETRAALADAADPDTKPKKRAIKKPFGLKFYWLAHISGREVHITYWYPTKVSRDTARQKAQAAPRRGFGMIKFTRIEEVER